MIRFMDSSFLESGLAEATACEAFAALLRSPASTIIFAADMTVVNRLCRCRHLMCVLTAILYFTSNITTTAARLPSRYSATAGNQVKPIYAVAKQVEKKIVERKMV